MRLNGPGDPDSVDPGVLVDIRFNGIRLGEMLQDLGNTFAAETGSLRIDVEYMHLSRCHELRIQLEDIQVATASCMQWPETLHLS